GRPQLVRAAFANATTTGRTVRAPSGRSHSRAGTASAVRADAWQAGGMARDDPAPAQPARARRADDLSDDVPAHEDLCVTRVPIFQGLTRQEQIEAAGFARPVTMAKGGTVYAPGQPVSRLLVV